MKYLIILLVFIQFSSCTNYPLIQESIGQMDEASNNFEYNFDKVCDEHLDFLNGLYAQIDNNAEIKIRILKERSYSDPNDLLEQVHDVQKKKEQQIRELSEKIAEFKEFRNKSKENFSDYTQISRDLKNYLKVMDGKKEIIGGPK